MTIGSLYLPYLLYGIMGHKPYINQHKYRDPMVKICKHPTSQWDFNENIQLEFSGKIVDLNGEVSLTCLTTEESLTKKNRCRITHILITIYVLLQATD
jgi:hypothetical protein